MWSSHEPIPTTRIRHIVGTGVALAYNQESGSNDCYNLQSHLMKSTTQDMAQNGKSAQKQARNQQNILKTCWELCTISRAIHVCIIARCPLPQNRPWCGEGLNSSSFLKTNHLHSTQYTFNLLRAWMLAKILGCHPKTRPWSLCSSMCQIYGVNVRVHLPWFMVEGTISLACKKRACQSSITKPCKDMEAP